MSRNSSNVPASDENDSASRDSGELRIADRPWPLDISHLADFRDVRDKYIDLENPPASTAIQVPRLFRPEFLVEIEAVAVVP